MSHVQGFPPIVGGQPRLLILGSMPGRASLEAVQYYAHPRNAFWPIMEDLLGIDRTLDYAQRCDRLRDRGVAVWDVLDRCFRPGSLDADIDPGSAEPNDFAGFLLQHRTIRHVYFNGAMAERSYRRQVLPGLPEALQGLGYTRLPSTSPANANYTFARKLSAWRAILVDPGPDGDGITSAPVR